MVDHGDGDGKVENARWMGKVQGVSHNGSVRLMLRGDVYERLGPVLRQKKKAKISHPIPVRGDDENVPIDSQVLSIPAAHIQAHRTRREATQKLIDHRPWLHVVNSGKHDVRARQTLYRVAEKCEAIWS